MPFTVEYTHRKTRGLLSATSRSQQNAEIAFKRTVGLMEGTDSEKELHLETIKKHDGNVETAQYAAEWAKSKGRREPTPQTIAANGERVFAKPTPPGGEEDDE